MARSLEKGPMKTLLVQEKIAYTGEQLHALWAYQSFGLKGDAIVAFQGPCDVRPEFMVDLEDLRAGAEIKARLMLHFIVELFDANLREAVLQQRLLVAITGEIINRKPGGLVVERRGDDLFAEERKLSVSIADTMKWSAKILITLAMAAIGLEVNLRVLAGVGKRAFLAGLLSTALLALATLVIIKILM